MTAPIRAFGSVFVPVVEFVGLTLAMTLVQLLSYQWFVWYTWIGRMLIGGCVHPKQGGETPPLSIVTRPSQCPQRSQLLRGEYGDDCSDSSQRRSVGPSYRSTYALRQIGLPSVARADFRPTLNQQVDGSSPSGRHISGGTLMPLNCLGMTSGAGHDECACQAESGKSAGGWDGCANESSDSKARAGSVIECADEVLFACKKIDAVEAVVSP